MNDNQKLVEGKDFTYDESGSMVLSKEFLLKRGHCCQSGCKNCPYGFGQKADPDVPAELLPEIKDQEPGIYEGEIPEEFLPDKPDSND